MNIFESIGNTTTRIEPFHSRFLANALTESVNGDRSLFDGFWRLVAPNDWTVPKRPDVYSEYRLRRGAIDILIKDTATRCMVGIEIKTRDESATRDQLTRYWDDLKRFGEWQVAMAYLTPFNRKWVGKFAVSLFAERAFRQFEDYIATECSSPGQYAKHVCWLDVASIPWNGNELWQQHQLYVYQSISSIAELRLAVQRDRSIDVFFGEEAAARFWSELRRMGIERTEKGDVDIDLAKIENPSELAKAFEILICEGENVAQSAVKQNDLEDEDSFHERFLGPRSNHRAVHEALFQLSKHGPIWLSGKKDYGIRVAHKNHSSGVSIATSVGKNKLKIVGKR